MSNNLLPIGSIVRIKGVTIEVMIAGYGLRKSANSTRIFDYLGLIWPKGMINNKENLLFDIADIEEVLHIGYKDNEQEKFSNKITEILNKVKNQTNE